MTTTPKKEGAMSIKDFRYISLIGSINNIISKVLSNRVKKKILDKTVSTCQNAFVEERHSGISFSGKRSG